MPRVHCASCGAPSVLGASRCPRCLAPFGAESPTSGVVVPQAPDRPWRVPRFVWVGVAAVAVMLAGGVLWWRRASEPATTPVAPVPATAPVPVPVAAPVESGPPEMAPEPAPAVSAEAAPVPAPVPALERATFAYVTTTWARVRVTPDNAAQVLTILAPGARVEVVEIARGWLRVRVPEGEGWVGAALLERVR